MQIPLRQYSGLLGRYLRPHWFLVVLLASLLLGSIAAQTLNPQVMRYFIDAAKAGEAMPKLITAALIFMGVALLNQGVTVAATYLGEKVGWLSTNALRENLALHCLKLDMAFHNRHTPGEMIERIDGDVANLANFFARFAIRVLGNFVLLIAVLVMLFREDWRVGVAMGMYSVITLTALMLIRNIAVPYWKDAREISSQLFGFIEEHLGGTEDIRSSGAVAYVMRLLHTLTGERLRKELKAGIMDILMWMLTGTLYTLGQIIAVGSGYYLFRQGVFTLGTVFMVVQYTDTMFRPLRQITREMEDLQKASASIVRVQELTDLQSNIAENPSAVLPSGALSVGFQDVSFAYEEEMVLEAISFHLEPGKVLGLLGRTGSGKTTLTRLLFRLYDPGAGTIQLGNVDVQDAHLRDLRHHVGMVTQNVQLFRASVRDNLTFFDSGVEDERILSVLRDVGLSQWYESLADGLDTEIQSGGAGLSAGEAQLLAFTRVFLKDPGLVILDEASSRLDPATEQLIECAVDKLLQNRTAIIIAHRLATVERADEILILEDGRIREYGERVQLVQNQESRFAELLRTGLQEVLA